MDAAHADLWNDQRMVKLKVPTRARVVVTGSLPWNANDFRALAHSQRVGYAWIPLRVSSVSDNTVSSFHYVRPPTAGNRDSGI